MKPKRDYEKKLKDFLNEGFEVDSEDTTNTFYRKGKTVIVWCKLHDKFIQRMEDYRGGFKVL